MMNKKQEELLNSFLLEIDDEFKPLYRGIAAFLSELGYSPKKEKSNIAFKHTLHNKQIAKMGLSVSKRGAFTFFALRFSACREYSQRFADIVNENILKYPAKISRCTTGGCSYCKGEAVTHIYTYTYPNGESKSHCGAYALVIPDINLNDKDEVKKLIKEEHDYLLEHEVG